MHLTVWTYEGPPHVGAMRVATAMRDVHYVLHAPQGDTYADLLFTMIERLPKRPPVTYTTFQARDLGGDTATLFQDAALMPTSVSSRQAMMVGASCTAELIQDDPGGLTEALDLPIPVVPLELPSYQRKENWGAAETFYHLVRAPAGEARRRVHARAAGPAVAAICWARPRWVSGTVTTCAKSPHCWSAGHRDQRGCAAGRLRPADIARLGEADFNVVLYPEIADTTARWLKRTLRPAATPNRADRRRRHARLHPRSGGAGGRGCRRRAGRCASRACPGTRAPLIRPT